MISNSDEEIKRQKRELDTVLAERDILGSQLVRRNDELSLLYQKCKLLQTLINNGNRIYNQRVEVGIVGNIYQTNIKSSQVRFIDSVLNIV